MIDTFTIRHISGPCGSVPFDPGHHFWSSRRRIVMASGERIRVTLFGHGADLAQDAFGANIFEWLFACGTSTDYPNAPVVFGIPVPKGFVAVDIRAAPEHGTGDRTVEVKWATGSEFIRVRIVADCNAVRRTAFRLGALTGMLAGPSIFVSAPAVPNLLPYVDPIHLLARPYGLPIATPLGDMLRVSDTFGLDASGNPLPNNVVTAVRVPDLTWGVSGVNASGITVQVDAQLFDATDPSNVRLLDTLVLPAGFPPNTPLVTTTNYPGRPATINVVNNPTFQEGAGRVTFVGTFTQPGTAQPLDPRQFLLVVDATNLLNEGSNENDNALRF